MLRLGCRLAARTACYWADLLTGLWDTFISDRCPEHSEPLVFRNERSPRNLSWLLQLIELETISLGLYQQAGVALALAGLYLVSRMALHQKRENLSWEEVCRHYQKGMSKNSNLVFCDSVGANLVFGDFLALFDLSIVLLIEPVQRMSRHLHPDLIKNYDYRKVEGANRQDRLSIHFHSEDLYRPSP